MSTRILSLLLSLVIVLVAGYFLALDQRERGQVDLRADELVGPVPDATAYAEFRWYANQLENLAIQSWGRGTDMGLIRGVMGQALDDMADIAYSEADTMHCDWKVCNPRLCAPWCPKDVSVDGE
jgi:hypothetical protein